MTTIANILAFLNLGGGEIVIVLSVLLLFFGAKKIPEFAKGMGKAIREFKDATNEVKEKVNAEVKELE